MEFPLTVWFSVGPRKAVPAEPRRTRLSDRFQRKATFGSRLLPVPAPGFLDQVIKGCILEPATFITAGRRAAQGRAIGVDNAVRIDVRGAAGYECGRPTRG